MKLPYLLKILQPVWSKESFQAAPFTPSAKRPILFTAHFFKVLLDFGGTICVCLFSCLSFFSASSASRNTHNITFHVKEKKKGGAYMARRAFLTPIIQS